MYRFLAGIAYVLVALKNLSAANLLVGTIAVFIGALSLFISNKSLNVSMQPFDYEAAFFIQHDGDHFVLLKDRTRSRGYLEVFPCQNGNFAPPFSSEFLEREGHFPMPAAEWGTFELSHIDFLYFVVHIWEDTSSIYSVWHKFDPMIKTRQSSGHILGEHVTCERVS